MTKPSDGPTVKIPSGLLTIGASALSAVLSGIFFSFWVGRSVVMKADLPEQIKLYSAYTQDKGKIDLTLETTKDEMHEVRQSVGSLKEKTDSMAAKVDIILEQLKALAALGGKR